MLLSGVVPKPVENVSGGGNMRPVPPPLRHVRTTHELGRVLFDQSNQPNLLNKDAKEGLSDYSADPRRTEK